MATKRKPITVRVKRPEIEALANQVAKDRGITMNDLVNLALENFLGASPGCITLEQLPSKVYKGASPKGVCE